MSDAATASAPGPHPLPRSVSALRSHKAPRRVLTRVSIADPAVTPSKPDDITASRSGSSSISPEISVTSSPWSKKLILTLDGGGIRGFSSLIILRALMDEIASIEKSLSPPAVSSADTDRIPTDNIPNEVLRKGEYLPCHYFDYIAGTSVGGLIAIMLGMLGMSVNECIDEFKRQNKAIPLTNDSPSSIVIDFPLLHKRSTWPTKRTRSFYDTFAKFSATATGRSLPQQPATPEPQTDGTPTEFKKSSFQCQTLAWCTEVESHKPYAFCSYEEHDTTEKLISIPEVAKAITTPFSSSFKPFKLGSGEFVDGSRQIRDPTLEVLREINTLLGHEDPAIDLVLSLGTDEHHAWFYEKLRRSDEASRSDLELSKEKGRSYKNYYRFEVPDIRLGLRKKFFLREIEEAAEKWLKDQADHIHRYAEVLVNRRRARSSTPRWEGFALGVRYFCFHEECDEKDVCFDSRGKFYDHLDRKHGLLKTEAKSSIEGELDKGRRYGCTSTSS